MPPNFGPNLTPQATVKARQRSGARPKGLKLKKKQVCIIAVKKEMIAAAAKKSHAGFGDAKSTKKNGGFQGTGIVIDLTAYKDSTEPIDIYVCAVPAGSSDRVVILYHFDDVTINK